MKQYMPTKIKSEDKGRRVRNSLEGFSVARVRAKVLRKMEPDDRV